MQEKRTSHREQKKIITYIRKNISEEINNLMEFVTSDISAGGVYILCDDLNLFELGEEFNIMVRDDQNEYYEGNAKVVRSARTFSNEKKQNQSGFGLMFLEMNDSFQEMLQRQIKD